MISDFQYSSKKRRSGLLELLALPSLVLVVALLMLKSQLYALCTDEVTSMCLQIIHCLELMVLVMLLIRMPGQAVSSPPREIYMYPGM